MIEVSTIIRLFNLVCIRTLHKAEGLTRVELLLGKERVMSHLH